MKIFKMTTLHYAGQRISRVDSAKITDFVGHDGCRLPWKKSRRKQGTI